MSDKKIFKVSDSWKKDGYVDLAAYEKKYRDSINNNENFWKEEGKRITWIQPYSKIKDITYSKKEVKIKWFYDGKLNASANCLDRYLKNKGNQTAIIWEGDDPAISKKISYQELCRS